MDPSSGTKDSSSDANLVDTKSSSVAEVSVTSFETHKDSSSNQEDTCKTHQDPLLGLKDICSKKSEVDSSNGDDAEVSTENNTEHHFEEDSNIISELNGDDCPAGRLDNEPLLSKCDSKEIDEFCDNIVLKDTSSFLAKGENSDSTTSSSSDDSSQKTTQESSVDADATPVLNALESDSSCGDSDEDFEVTLANESEASAVTVRRYRTPPPIPTRNSIGSSILGNIDISENEIRYQNVTIPQNSETESQGDGNNPENTGQCPTIPLNLLSTHVRLPEQPVHQTETLTGSPEPIDPEDIIAVQIGSRNRQFPFSKDDTLRVRLPPESTRIGEITNASRSVSADDILEATNNRIGFPQGVLPKPFFRKLSFKGLRKINKLTNKLGNDDGQHPIRDRSSGE